MHIVAHGSGGLVARTFIERYPERWRSMWDTGQPAEGFGQHREPGTLGGRLVLLGTPNHGTFETPQAMVGLGRVVRRLADLDLRHDTRTIVDIFNTFVAPYQMLPSPLELPGVAPLCDPRTYGDLEIFRHRLATAEEHHSRLHDVVDAERMVCVNGGNRPTISGITDYRDLSDSASYTVTWDGDGWVPHRLSRLGTGNGAEVRSFFADEDHGGLLINRSVLSALDDILQTGTTRHLTETPPRSRAGEVGDGSDEAARAQFAAERYAEDIHFEPLLRRSRSWRMAADVMTSHSARDLGSAATSLSFASADEVQIEECLAQGMLSTPEKSVTGVPIVPFTPATIEIRVVAGNIADLGHAVGGIHDGEPVDVISVGHYLGSTPQTSCLALDRAISAALPGRTHGRDEGQLDDTDLMITQLSERGTIRGELGQTFFMNDPRPSTGQAPATARLIALAGMGVPGRFGEPELTVVARELCWALGQMGKRHLATVLIGAGRGNLKPREATLAWMRGIRFAITGSVKDEQRSLRRLTFVDRNPETIRIIQLAILDEKQRLDQQNRLVVSFTPLDEKTLTTYERRWRREKERAEHVSPSSQAGPNSDTVVPSRVTVRLDEQGVYRFGAITEDAAIPEREIPVDPTLIEQANDELVAARDTAAQYHQGQFLEQLLLPDEFRTQVYTGAPLVLMLDATMARVHWELVAQSEYDLGSGWSSREGGSRPRGGDIDARRFLGTSRGVTGQLCTTFAQPPDPPPPPRRLMRVLIVADPAADNHLPGAKAEGAAIAELFEHFNTVHQQSDNRIEVVTLLGPQEATRTSVLRHLMMRSYDILHFAGHCVYDKANPLASGWIFTDAKRITASELNRIDRVPNFIFSNACESGVTPDRVELRSVNLGPTFAEAFFARGVTNFVCTAWPVDDTAAHDFALTLYERLLGLEPADATRRHYLPVSPEQMHVAMRDARLAIAETPLGVQTWGSYQHYGTPYMRFFDPAVMGFRAGGASNRAKQREETTAGDVEHS